MTFNFFKGGSPSMSSGMSTPSIKMEQIHHDPAYFHSRRVKKGEVDKPWLGKKQRRDKIVDWAPYVGIFIGVCAAALIIWDGLRTSINNSSYCEVYTDDFSSGILNPDIWQKEVEVGGFGNGQFEETTATDENVFIKDGMLVIKPTLQNPALIGSNNQINLLKDGSCTGTGWSNCVATTNTTNGTIINPVKSGRINTRKGANIKFGKVEIVARLPKGDWLWPALWMLPKDSVYGAWPASGEIDIVEGRGNNHTVAQGGNNIVSSTLHWGPDSGSDAWYQTNYKHAALHTTFASGFHTFGMEWSEKYLFTYVDSRLLQVGYTKFSKPMWQRGNFATMTSVNGTALVDPWSQTGSDATPFDQDFYLILNVAVGGTNGWFQDGDSGKPWVNGDPRAPATFWQARDQWYPTWEENGQMTVKSIKMLQLQGYNGCTNGKKR